MAAAPVLVGDLGGSAWITGPRADATAAVDVYLPHRDRDMPPVYAANAGTVILCPWNGGYGNNVMIQHDDGVVSVYGHGSKLLCHEGQQVRAGDLLMLSGNTGYSTGPHLHFELRRNDKPFDAV